MGRREMRGQEDEEDEGTLHPSLGNQRDRPRGPWLGGLTGGARRQALRDSPARPLGGGGLISNGERPNQRRGRGRALGLSRALSGAVMAPSGV